MVARPDPPTAGRRGASDPVSGLFQAWRRVLTSVARTPGAAAQGAVRSRTARRLGLALSYAADPAGTLAAASASDRDRLKEAGAAALVIGAAVAFGVSLAIGSTALESFLAMGWVAAWALARLALLRLASSASSKADRRLVDDAWGPALLPFLGAVAFPLDIAALAVSAFLTHRGLTALGLPRGRAARATAWAFGGQLTVEFIAWIGRAGLLAYIRL